MKKRIIAVCLVAGLLLVGFQVANNHLHLLQSPGVVISDYVEPDYELGPSHVDSLLPFPDVKKESVLHLIFGAMEEREKHRSQLLICVCRGKSGWPIIKSRSRNLWQM